MAVLFVVGCCWLQASESAGEFINVQIAGSSLSFSLRTPAPPQEWTLQTAMHPSGIWSNVSPSSSQFPFQVLVPANQPAAFFRFGWEGKFSSNLAGYLRLSLPAGFSMVAHPFLQGRNTLEEILPQVPEGTQIYKFDPVRQVFATVSQFQFGAWDHPHIRLLPGKGAYLRLPEAFEWTFAGILAPMARPQLEGGWNMISLPFGGVPEPQECDWIVRLTQAGFLTYEAAFGQWTPDLAEFSPGESFWYFRNEQNPNAEPAAASVYFHNYAPQEAIQAPVFAGTCVVPGPYWMGELWILESPSSSRPLGNPVPMGSPGFHRTGIAGLEPGLESFGVRSRTLTILPPRRHPLKMARPLRIGDTRKDAAGLSMAFGGGTRHSGSGGGQGGCG